MKAEKLTARSTKNNMAYLLKVKDGEQCVDGSYNTLKCIQEAFEKLAKYEECEDSMIEQARIGRAVQKAFELSKTKGKFEGMSFLYWSDNDDDYDPELYTMCSFRTVEGLLSWAEEEQK